MFVSVQALKVRLADVTRETVQKSVCVLSRVVSHPGHVTRPGQRDGGRERETLVEK